MAFPEQRDKALQERADSLVRFSAQLSQWVATFNPQRKAMQLAEVQEADEFLLLKLRRQAGSLARSSKVPVAAGTYGASQTGKSLFMGRVLLPGGADRSPLGRQAAEPPVYYEKLSFATDLNPRLGSNEATALVTRFTTPDRLPECPAPEFPVMVRALSRAEWLRVLARGFMIECATPEYAWVDDRLEALFAEVSRTRAGTQVNHEWRMDLLDAYVYAKSHDPRGFNASEAQLNGYLCRYPLTSEGYEDVAAALFWNRWPDLTNFFREVATFLDSIHHADQDAGIFSHWASVRFLLDSQRLPSYDSECLGKPVSWKDMELTEREGWHVLHHRPGWGGGTQDVATLQAAMLELVIPVMPDRLNPQWREVIHQMDILDIPGMRAGKQGVEQGKRHSAAQLAERMEIVKRGKVAYLFERYTDDLQMQSLLLLAKGGNLEVSGFMKAHVDRWGRSRYGDKWPHHVRDPVPALFIGMTGIDEEFRAEQPSKALYKRRLEQLGDTLGSMFQSFGGGPFDNVYPLRYPGTWDEDECGRQQEGLEKWENARQAFLEEEWVIRHVRDGEKRWQAAMDDNDGGTSLISAGFQQATSTVAKQDDLDRRIAETRSLVLQLAKGWLVSKDVNLDREIRAATAQKVLDWLSEDEDLVYHRVHAVQQSLCFRPGDLTALADLPDTLPSTESVKPEPIDRRFTRHLKDLLNEWATSLVPPRWEEFIDSHDYGKPWLDVEVFGTLARHLRDYLSTDRVFDRLSGRLLPVIELTMRDEAALRQARRKYVRLVLNDYIINPGPSTAHLQEVPDVRDRDFGLMEAFVKRWWGRLPVVLAAAAGDEQRIPPGNEDLDKLIQSFD